MQTIPSLLRNRYLARFGALLIAVALIAGTVGCPAAPAARYTLTVSSTAGGSVTDPGEGEFTFGQAAVVNLLAEAEGGYRFVNWTGDVGAVANVNSAATTITASGGYSIRANFVAVYNLTISSTEGGSVTAPGEGTFTYDEGTMVNLTAEAEEGYLFVNWTGDVTAISDVDAATTTISMSGDYSVTASFEVERTGALLDEVVITKESSPEAAVTRLGLDELDVYALGIGDPELLQTIIGDPSIEYVNSVSTCKELTLNPVPFFLDGRFNPFGFPEIREAINKLMDREYIVQEIMGGRGIPRYTCLTGVFADAVDRYPHLITQIEAEYAYDKAAAEAEITAEMEAQGAYIDGTTGTWHYDGEELEIVLLIRTEDERKEIGEYLGAQLGDIGFKCRYNYRTADEAAPIWIRGSPAKGAFHVYTGGWISLAINRDQAQNFAFFYTDMGYPLLPLWMAYDTDPEFYEVCQKLNQNYFTTLEEREALFAEALPLSLKDSARIWLADDEHFSALRSNVRLAADLSGGVSGGFWNTRAPNVSRGLLGTYGSWMWALTGHFIDEAGNPVVGGTMRIAIPDVLADPWNAVAGSDWIWDVFPIRATGDLGHWPDTRTGLRWPGRIEKADVFVQSGLPATVTNTDWCSLTFVPEIQVPIDAWADWDAVNQRFRTVRDRYGAGGTTTKTKSVSYYPEGIFDIQLHDGSTLSMGDFILYTILQFDRAKEASPIYDESAVGAYNGLMNHFKGVRFITDNPNYGLIVEYYSDNWQLDAELMVTTMFPFYSQGPGMWHTIALGIRAEKDGALAFSQSKSNMLGVEWMSFISGPSLPFLRSYLSSAKATNYLPYEPTVGLYVSHAEAAERWSNLEEWYANKGHFWVGSGPFYLENADTTAKVIRLKRFEDYPDAMDRWLFLLQPLP